MVNGSEGHGGSLVAEGAKSMSHVGGASRLFGHEVGNHFRCGFESRFGVAEFSVLATKMGLHFHVASSGLVGGMKRHSNGALVVAKKTRGLRKSETKITKEHANVENLFDTLRLSAIFGLLGGEAHRRAELDPPANPSAIEKNDMSASRAAIVEISTPIAVGETVGFVRHILGVEGAIHEAIIACTHEIAGDTLVTSPQFLTRIVDVPPEDAYSMGNVRTTPDGEVDEFAMGGPDFVAESCVNNRRAVSFGVDDVGIQGRTDRRSVGGVEIHSANELIDMTA